MFTLDQQVAVVTGAGSGIGRAIARVFAGAGAYTALVDIDEPGGVSVMEEIRKAGGKGAFFSCDVTDQLAVWQTMENLAAAQRSINILVNNAGIAHVGNAENTSEADFDRLMRVNVKGMYNCLNAVIPIMKVTGGVIINMASVAARVGIPDRFAYSATKGAVMGMTLSVAKDFLLHGIRCNSISPGRVHTPFVDGFIAKNYPGQEKEMFEKLSKTQPIGRMAEPDEIAHLALYLASKEASFITGTDYPIDGGFITLNS